MVEALNGAPLSDDEAVCASQMRGIISNGKLSYRSLVDDPGALLAASSYAVLTNGALWTRFTVSYNLYAGSIVALGSERQRDELFASQPRGELGCFAFTEKGAGVLSGAAVETTATYDPATESFVLHSPTASSCKTCEGGYFLVFVPTIQEIRDFSREKCGTNRESVTLQGFPRGCTQRELLCSLSSSFQVARSMALTCSG
eukprot:SAG31_NODE_7066_length_1798_cov_2.214244_2_plen_201_part_00